MTRKTLMAAAFAALAWPAAADPFTLFIHETPADVALRSDTTEAGAAYWAVWAEYSAMLGETGMVRGGAPLVVSEGDGNRISGYFILEAPSLAEAEALAALAPAATRGGRVDVVAHFPMPGMSN